MKIDSVGIDTDINTVCEPVFLIFRGLHIGRVELLGTTGFGVTGGFFGGHTVVEGID